MQAMKHVWAGVLAVTVVAGGLFWAWKRYESFLTQGMRPPETIQKLNELQQAGLPDFSLPNLRGEKFSLGQYAGKVVLLSFWASWCNPCVQEFPSMLKLVEKFKGDVVFLAVSADNSEEDMRAFVNLMKADVAHVQIAWDRERKVAELYGTESLPESYIIGTDGKLVRKIVGSEDWASPMAIKFFEQLLAKK